MRQQPEHNRPLAVELVKSEEEVPVVQCSLLVEGVEVLLQRWQPWVQLLRAAVVRRVKKDLP
jgi:hypothetical protein